MALFIDADINTDASALTDDAIDNLKAAFAANGIDWNGENGDFSVITFGTIAQVLAAPAADTAGQVTSAIFRKFGTDLAGVPYIQGAAATVLSTWTAVDTAGYTLPAGTFVTIGTLGFYVQSDQTITAGTNSVSNVLLIAADVGTAYNGLTGPAELVDALDWVQSIAIVGTTSGGADPETDDDYQNRLTGQLALQAPRPITASDYATFVQSFPPAAGTDQEEVGRATAIDGYDVAAIGTFTSTTTSGSATLTAVSGGVSANVGAGTVLSGTGIPTNTTVVANNGSSIVMSANATSSNVGETTTATGLYNQSRAVTTFIAAADGTQLNTDTVTAVQTWLQSFREVNFLAYVRSPTYTTVYVTFQIAVYPNADPAGTVTAAQAALTSYLSPSGWGQSGTTGTTNGQWVNDTTVRVNKLIGLIEAVPGVAYVPAGGLTLGTSPSPAGTTDLSIPGPAALVESDATTVIGSHT